MTAPDNIIKYNYKDRLFKADPPGPLDHLAVHFAMDGAAIHINSNEAKEQMAYNERRKKKMASKQNAAVPAIAEEEGEDANWVRTLGSLVFLSLFLMLMLSLMLLG